MSEVHPLSEAEIEFLAPFLPCNNGASKQVKQDGRQPPNAPISSDGSGSPDTRTAPSKENSLPFVTLTYASSLDSMVSLAPGLRTTLSGPETKSMTHYLRMHHNAILVGVGTAIPDDPALNCRYPGATFDSQPRPVIVDPQMRWKVAESKVEQLAFHGQGKEPWLVHTPRPLPNDASNGLRAERFLIAGVAENGHEIIEWTAILRTLKQRGIDSVMIEGGATIISALLNIPSLVNSVIITIAPTWLGQGGVMVCPSSRSQDGQRVNAARLEQTSWKQFGQDAVLCGRLMGS